MFLKVGDVGAALPGRGDQDGAFGRRADGDEVADGGSFRWLLAVGCWLLSES
jgi:hypothetical protein